MMSLPGGSPGPGAEGSWRGLLAGALLGALLTGLMRSYFIRIPRAAYAR